MTIADFHMPTRIAFGAGRRTELAGILDRLGIGKFLVVTDSGLVKAGVTARVLTGIDRARYVIFDGVSPDPTIAQARAVADLARTERVEGVLAIGGGSPIDCAKGALVLIADGGDLRRYEGPHVFENLLPLVAVPTTAGTGSEVTSVAVIIDPDRNRKMVLRADALLPRLALLDPELLAGAPATVAAWSGIDAVTHAVETFVAHRATPFSDALARQAMMLLGRNLHAFVADRSNSEAAAGTMIGACLAGAAFNHAGLGLAHALAHPIGSNYGVPHGLTCGILLPQVVRFNLDHRAERYREVAAILSGRSDASAESLVGLLFDLNDSIGVPRSLATLGFAVKPTEAIIRYAKEQPVYRNNPRLANDDEMIELVRLVA